MNQLTPFDEAGYRQQLIDLGTPADQASDIARKTAEARLKSQQDARATARAEAQEEGRLRALRNAGQGLQSVARHLPESPTSNDGSASSAEAAGAAAAVQKKQPKPRPPSLPKSPRQARKPKGPAPLSDQAFSNQQLGLFQTFLANDQAQRDLLSNSVDLWDSIPRYSLSRRKQEELREPGGYLPIRKITFHYRSTPLTAVIRPARIEQRDGQGKPTGGTVEYYPSAREELIEQALRRLATDRNSGFFDDAQPRSGLQFTLYSLRQELALRGHSITHRDLAEGLDVLSLSHIDIETEDKDSLGLRKFGRSSFIVNLAGVKREDLERNPHAKWYVEFHPFVTASFSQITYRQFNYDRMMKCRTQLARWLLSQLVLKYTQAALGNSFVMKYSTIKRDSGLLDGYKLERQAVAALDDAWEDLKSLNVLASFSKEEQRGARAKLEDVSYTLHPTHLFAKEQRAANKRQLDAKAVTPAPEQESLL